MTQGNLLACIQRFWGVMDILEVANCQHCARSAQVLREMRIHVRETCFPVEFRDSRDCPHHLEFVKDHLAMTSDGRLKFVGGG